MFGPLFFCNGSGKEDFTKREYTSVYALKNSTDNKLREFYEDMNALMSMGYQSNLIQYFGAVLDQSNGMPVWLLMEHVHGTSLEHVLLYHKSANTFLTRPIIQSTARDILTGLIYLHTYGLMMHLDLKPSNILIEKNGIYLVHF